MEGDSGLTMSLLAGSFAVDIQSKSHNALRDMETF